ncbi:hypothetical protein FOMA001_g36 [Fusarium oxysporum f. sp. matthiolae]|nr:hypothetical protein FOMA001_g36 [Fusarium oxysporum f. sp. matthiolae]
MDISLDSDILGQLNTVEAKALHRISDDLSACGVGKIVNLPQVIVVGEQSAGKSSVLEAISHIRFPVDGSLCTRFATELVFHHANENCIDATVRFADKTKPSQSFQRKRFHEDDLPDIIREAKEYMGLSRLGKDFSKDVLRLEVEGPNIYPLSLVDLPGLYHTDTQDQSLGGRDTVNELVESYMKQKKSIILVVIAANVNLANHIALDKAKTIDPQRQRTIGVITKPDLALTANSKEYIRVAKNQESAHKLELGWHVLRNRGEDETSLQTRDEIEESFFETHGWATIPRQDRGIATFRSKLSGILFNHIRNSLPGVIDDIEIKIRDRQKELTRLGDPRSKHKHWRSYMLTIASDFQRLARDGCNGQYNDPFFGGLEDEDLKFRALLRNFNRVFDHILRTKGSTQNIVLPDEDKPKEDELPEYLARFLNQYPYEFPDPERITIQELSIELENKAAANQGREFPGSPNADLAMQLFKSQAAPWKQIAQFHVDTVATVAKAFVDQLFKHVIGSPQNNPTTEAILATCVDPFFEEKEKLLRDKIDELLRPYSQGYSLPVDIEFYRALSQKSTNRIANRICKTMEHKYPELFNQADKNRFTPEQITQAMAFDQNSRAGQFGTDKIIDMMLTYYEMSRRTFTDNVINLAIESCLVCSIPDILTPTQVDGMDKERLKELAAEPVETTSRRNLLRAEVKVLQNGLDKCRKHKPRPVTGLPSYKPVITTSAPSTTSNLATTVPTVSVPAASNPVASNSIASVPAAENTKPTSELPSKSTTMGANGSTTGQAPCSTTKYSAAGGAALPSPGTVVPRSEPGQNGVSPAPGKSTSPSGGPNVSASPGSSGPTGGLSGGNGATVTSQLNPTMSAGFGSIGSSSPQLKPNSYGFGSGGGSSTRQS